MAKDSFSIDVKGLNSIAKMLDTKKFDRASVNAINQTATRFRKDTVDDAAKIYNIKKARIKKDSNSKDTTFIRRARKSNQQAQVVFRAKRPGLQHFGPPKMENLKRSSAAQLAAGKRKGPKVRIKRTDAKEMVPRGFYATPPKFGGRGLFQRTGDARYPIERRSGPSIKQMYTSSLQTKTEKKIPLWLEENFNKAIDKQFR